MNLEYRKEEDIIASRLDVAHNPDIAKIRGEFFKAENNFFAENINNEKVIVAGSGLGHDAIELAKNNSEVVGVELLERLVDSANERVKEIGVKNLKFVCSDIYQLPFNEGTFDSSVLNMGTIGNFDDKERVISELLRVSKKLYFDFYPPTKEGLEKRKEMYTQEGWNNVRIEDDALVSDDGLYSKSINDSEIQKMAEDLKVTVSLHNLNKFAVMAVLEKKD